MATRSRKTPARRPPPPARTLSWQSVLPPLLLVSGVISFYWLPLTASDAHLQWDAIDVHYSSQRYLAQRLHSGVLPFWTPYIFSGFPFLADPQTGAWYPLNWPFFLAGITPQAIALELILHVALACIGAYVLATRLLNDAVAGLGAAFAYALSGFFAAHTSHLGMVQTAAWLPWLLLAVHEAVHGAGWAWAGAGGLVGGMMILAGHPQTAIYALLAVVAYSIAEVAAAPSRVVAAGATVGVVLILAPLISAVQSVPAAILFAHSIRAGVDTSNVTEGVLRLASLATLAYPDYFRALIGALTILRNTTCTWAYIVNYADDFVICCRGTATHAMAAMREMMRRLRLTVNEEKTRRCRVGDEAIDFLGYTIGRCYSPKTGKVYIGTTPSKQTIQRLCREISELTERRWLLIDTEVQVGRLNRRLRGWANYFCLGPVSKAYRAVDRHTASRLRQWLRRKHQVQGRGTARFPDAYLYQTLNLVRLTARTRNFAWANA